MNFLLPLLLLGSLVSQCCSQIKNKLTNTKRHGIVFVLFIVCSISLVVSFWEGKIISLFIVFLFYIVIILYYII